MIDPEEAPVRLTAAGKPRKPGKRGGARPGAGRKPKVVPDATFTVEDETMSMLEFLRLVALGKIIPSALQVAAARTAVQYESVKSGDGGKREQLAAMAQATSDDLPTTPPPAMRVVK